MSSGQTLIPLEQTGQFGKLFLDYVSGKNTLEKFYEEYPDDAGINNYLNNHRFDYIDRAKLVSELHVQNNELNISEHTQNNINLLLSDHVFTVTTGHQLCLFTGPLYFIYKILSVINYCEYLNQKFSSKKFVPVYWLASEDHDFEEINHAYIFGKKLSWNSSQTGKVGKFKTAEIEKVITELEQISGTSDNAKKIINLLRESYSKQNLAKATRYLVNELFGQYGLIIMDGDSNNLKKLFSQEILKELESGFSYDAVTTSNKALTENEYNVQVNPRFINLFYANKSIRERIELSNGIFKVHNTELSFTPEQIKDLLNNTIEVFSPNVVLRPLYQQKILPNVAYVGGPGEIAYWLQLKLAFDQTNISFPLLVPRKFILLLDENIQVKLSKNSLTAVDVFLKENELISKILKPDKASIDFTEFKNQLADLFGKINNQVSTIDKSIAGTAEAEMQKALKGIENIEQKINKALKQKNETSINQIRSVLEKLFPEGNIQERHDNFISFYIKSDDFIASLKSYISMDPKEIGKYLIQHI